MKNISRFTTGLFTSALLYALATTFSLHAIAKQELPTQHEEILIKNWHEWVKNPPKKRSGKASKKQTEARQALNIDFQNVSKLDVTHVMHAMVHDVKMAAGNSNDLPTYLIDIAIPILQSDLGSNGYMITKSGHYYLPNDLSFKPKQAGRSAIVIHAPNVVLDLNGRRLRQEKTSGIMLADTNGILIDGQDSIVIENGQVSDFTGNALFVSTGSSHIAGQNLQVVRTGKSDSFGGIYVLESSDLMFDNIQSYDNYGTGLLSIEVQRMVVLNSHFDNNLGGNYLGFGPENICFGLGILNEQTTQDIIIADCTTNNNFSGAVTTGIGIFSVPPAPTIKNVSIINCTANGNNNGQNITFESDATGIALVAVENYYLKNCVCNSNKKLFPPSIQAPYELNGSTGFSLNGGSRGLVENCIAHDNSGIGTTAVGIRVRGSSQIALKNCFCAGNKNFSNDGEAWGFHTNPLPDFFGFPAVSVNHVYDSCVAEDNSALSGFSGGFKFRSQIDSQMIACKSLGNKDYLPSDTSLARQSYGIFVDDPTPMADSRNNILKNNLIEGNAVAGISDQTSANNAYIANVARSNGPNGTANYVGAIFPTATSCISPGSPGTPVQLWIVPNAPCAQDNNGVISPLDNLDIRP